MGKKIKIVENFKKFTKFSLIWYSQQFAIPFWIIGHIHLHLNDYHNIVEILSSISMNALVAIGFWLDWKDYSNKESK